MAQLSMPPPPTVGPNLVPDLAHCAPSHWQSLSHLQVFTGMELPNGAAVTLKYDHSGMAW
jgi:hypothetical protein